MDDREGTITVRGEAVVPAEPDELRLRLIVSAVRPQQADALEDVTARSHALDSLLDELDVPKPMRTTSGLSIREKREWVTEATAEGTHRERSVHRGYEVHNSMLVRLDDPTIAGRLLEGAVERAQAHVEGPSWHVDGANPARIEACREAARDGRRKAEAYAGALGLRIGVVSSVSESLEVPWRGGAMLSGAARTEEIGIEPGQLDVFATVTIEFAIEP
jgi:uncharacterized protein YggE